MNLKIVAYRNFKELIKPLGLVFGDIGTSPIYTLPITFAFVKHSLDNILGVISLVIWTLTIIVCIEYVWLAMSLGKKGEGGTIVLKEILVRFLKTSKTKWIATLLSFLGISLLVGDGVITPSISILSAVEGILIIPGFEKTNEFILIAIASVIAIGLFSYQKKGTDKVAKTFGPFMLVWFLVLGITGAILIFKTPYILNAFNPYWAIKFLLTHSFTSFFILSCIFLCATGGEALYADMGHLGKKPIIKAWYFVFISLVLNYLGQGAFFITHPNAKVFIFEMMYYLAHYLYIPFLILSIMATIIASQALISGMFSIIYQAITTRIVPMFKIDYTSPRMRSQIYIGTVNWFLLIFVLLLMFIFKRSEALGAAYGLAVSGTMTITGLFMIFIFLYKKKYIQFSISIFITIVDLIFLFSNILKIPHGGYWSIIIAFIPFSLILIYNWGQKCLYRSIGLSKQDDFLTNYNNAYSNFNKIKGTALFFARDIKQVPPYISRTMFINKIIYEQNIFISIITKNEPYGIKADFVEDVAPGLRRFEVSAGYFEVCDLENILKKFEINEIVIFYGVEDIVTENFALRIFALIKKISPSFVQFYRLPINKVHGVVTRVDL